MATVCSGGLWLHRAMFGGLSVHRTLVRYYNVHPLPKGGAEVIGLKLQDHVTPSLIETIKADVTKHNLLLFRDQGYIDADRQIEITEWFAPVDTTPLAGFPVHAKAPHSAILRLSNDPAEGHQEFGTRGFHVDGSYMEKPNAYAFYQMVKATKSGTTWFVKLNQVLAGLSTEKRQYWDSLSLVRDQRGDTMVVHPLIYKHPVTGLETMCIHLGNLSHFIEDHGLSTEKALTSEQSDQIAADIDAEIRRDDNALVIEQQWRDGDFMMSDNLAVAHRASPGTQTNKDAAGLRVLHRTFTVGLTRPTK